jgi:hypothetical protein
MIRAYLEAAASAVVIALSISIVIMFAAIGCAMNKRDSYTSHNVQGFRAPVLSHVSSNR